MEIVKVLDSHQSPTEMFAKWIYNASKNGHVISKARITREICSISGRIVTENNVTSWVSKAREYLEEHMDCTLWNVPGEGWRISTKRENAVYYAKSVKKTIAWADRTTRLQLISDRRDIPGALREVFLKAEGGIKSLSKTKERYFMIWANLLQQQKQVEERVNGKLIEHK